MRCSRGGEGGVREADVRQKPTAHRTSRGGRTSWLETGRSCPVDCLYIFRNRNTYAGRHFLFASYLTPCATEPVELFYNLTDNAKILFSKSKVTSQECNYCTGGWAGRDCREYLCDVCKCVV